MFATHIISPDTILMILAPRDEILREAISSLAPLTGPFNLAPLTSTFNFQVTAEIHLGTRAILEYLRSPVMGGSKRRGGRDEGDMDQSNIKF